MPKDRVICNKNLVFIVLNSMAHVYEITSYIEAVLRIKGFEVVRRNAYCPGVIIVNVLRSQEIISTLRIDKDYSNDYFDFGDFFLIGSLEDAERFLEKFDSIIS